MYVSSSECTKAVPDTLGRIDVSLILKMHEKKKNKTKHKQISIYVVPMIRNNFCIVYL